LDELAARVGELDPDLVLFDVNSERLLLEARAFADAFPAVRLLALAMAEIPREVIACAEAGFSGYVARETSLDDLPTILQMALRGEVSCHPTITSSLLHEIRRRRHGPESSRGEPLTRRECEVLRLVARGLSNKTIACQLGLSPATVKNHLHIVFGKLGVGGRAEAAARLRDEPWVQLSA
jgi:DNA-binding NarL/FixJ family response regulator